nr:unnamed protein product [Callosobruchus chinensis]
MNNQFKSRSCSINFLGVNILDEHVLSIATAAGKKPHLSSERKYFSPSNLHKLSKAQIRPGLECGSHIWRAAAPTAMPILDTVQRRVTLLMGDLASTRHLQLLSRWRAVGDRSLFY